MTAPAASDLAISDPQSLTYAALLLQNLPKLGPATYWRLIERFDSPAIILAQAAAQLSEFLGEEARSLLADYQSRGPCSELGVKVAADVDYLQQESIEVLHPQHPAYPDLLRETHRAPFVLYARGNLECLATPQIAIVGSRNPSPGGHHNAKSFARYLCKAGFTVTSGLALGVDGAAHEGALAVDGKTVAVLGTGIDRVYPARHRDLAQRIVDKGGLLLTEFPLKTRPTAGNFPQRNRIISGMSLGVLVVEAALKSGSLITARCAMEQNREVFAIPGSIHNPLSRGCHGLIREGATLVETAADMVGELQGLLSFKAEAVSGEPACQSQEIPPGVCLEPLEKTVFLGLGFDPVPIDQLLDLLLEQQAWDVGQLMAQLTSLEIKGLIVQSPQGYQRREA